MTKKMTNETTLFESDPMVTDIFTGEDGDYFGLVLVANWPVSPLADMDGPYKKFLAAVKSCFRAKDVTPSDKNPASLPAVYLYPTMHLHITLATLPRSTKIGSPPALPEDVQRAIKQKALELVQAASRLPGWPKKPLRLVVDAAQIGTRAGILLWNDLSGGVAAMRRCLEEASTDDNGSSVTNIVDITIPTIVHSTFLRFAELPLTPGEEVQAAFRSRGLGTPGKEFFCIGDESDDDNSAQAPLVLTANTVRLVSESIPYMHLPNDDKHVLWTNNLTK